MSIQWFPGHMTAARDKAAATMARSDLVIEVVDARLPEASSNPLIADLRRARQRPCLKVLNKADLADAAATAAWLEHLGARSGVAAVAISCKKPGDAARIPALCRRLAPHRGDGVKPLRLLVMGIPNVGKSTLLNALVKRRVAAVGDEPAITKHQQSCDLGVGMTITDTPGLMWPRITHDSDGFMLAASHAIGRNAVDDEVVAKHLGDLLLARYAGLLAARYRCDAASLQDGFDVLAAVAKRRGCQRGGVIDYARAAALLLNDYRSGALGRISLETPGSRAAMLAPASEAPPPVADAV